MDEITVILWAGAFIALIIQYKLRWAPVYFLGMGLGMGGIYQTFAEYDNGTIEGAITVLMVVMCLVSVIYSIWGFIQTGGGRK